MQYKNFVAVAPRFARAINIERDADIPGTIDGYIITSTARETLSRISQALISPVGSRAWTLLGSYGSGKSSFALYLSNLFSPPHSSAGKLARTLLHAQCNDVFREFFGGKNRNRLLSPGFLPVLVTGSAEPLLPAIVRASYRDLRRHWTHGRPPSALVILEKMGTLLKRGKSVNPSEFVEVIVDIAQRLQSTGRARGVLFVIDELGKFLEAASRDPERGDIFVLQQLAEATGKFRSGGLALITILHQSFERYVSGLRPTLRDEWAKVQGRFEDIAFQEPPDQLLRVISSALKHSTNSTTNAIQQRARAYAEAASSLGLTPLGMTKHDFVTEMSKCAPLHPLTVLALTRLCRKFGQNERSLFSFLISREPKGFSSFLLQDVSTRHFPFYRLPALYDYAAQALGNGLDIGDSATRWAEVRDTLDRCQTFSPTAIEMIKAVGLLTAIGSQGNLKPSRDIIQFCFDENPSAAKEAREELLKQSVLVCRKHSGTYALWQGSDIDIDLRTEEARRRTSQNTSLAKNLSALWVPRPLVAKRHSFMYGTLRYFLVRFADQTEFSKTITPDQDADGILLYCVPNSDVEFQQLQDLAQSSGVRDRVDVVIAIPRNVEGLRDSVRELELLRWVESNTPELAGDAVARRELRARITLSEQHVAGQIRSLFSPDELTAQRTVWFHRGIPKVIKSGRLLTSFLSEICESVYKDTPRLRNELLNRRVLSSAAAKARRNLIEAMVYHRSEAKLGINGTPPEMSMYQSLLEATGIHRSDGIGYDFAGPQRDKGLIRVWRAIETFFDTCELARRPLSDLFAILQRPPYGLKAGVIPVLFCAAALAHDMDVGIYEGGTFTPELTVQVFERLLHSPDRFELRRYRVEGVRAEAFRLFAKLLGATPHGKGRYLVTIVRPLYRFFNRLPEYSKRTTTLSDKAIAIRDALSCANEPDALLFDSLPRACGHEPFLPTKVEKHRVIAFFRSLKSALAELQRAYDDLLADLQRLLFEAFNLAGPKPREVIRFRAQRLAEHIVDPRLRAFVHHLSDEQLSDVAWIEALATLLGGKPPHTWLDSDRTRFELSLSELVRTFRHMEALAFEIDRYRKLDRTPAHVLRIGVTDIHSKEKEAVVTVQTDDEPKLAYAVTELETSLDRLALTPDPTLALAALAIVSRRFLSELESSAAKSENPPEEVEREQTRPSHT